LQTEPNQIHSEPNPSFFSRTEPKPNRIKKSIPHIHILKSPIWDPKLEKKIMWRGHLKGQTFLQDLH